MYAAIKEIQKKKKKEPLLIDTGNGITTNEKTQVEIITKFYKEQFNQLNINGILNAEPCEMSIPFTREEIEKAVKKLGNNKSAGIDGIKGEHIKNSPPEVFQLIADILNETAKTGQNPKENMYFESIGERQK